MNDIKMNDMKIRHSSVSLQNKKLQIMGRLALVWHRRFAATIGGTTLIAEAVERNGGGSGFELEEDEEEDDPGPGGYLRSEALGWL